jgi:outer membrane protein TolC
VESSLAAYRVGGVEFMTLLDSRMAVNEYRQELLALVADEGRAWAELEMLVGRELINANSVAAGPSAVGGAR